MSWLSKHWRKIAGYGCAIVATGLEFTPYKAAGLALGAVCGSLLTTEYHEAQRVVEITSPLVREVRDALAIKKKLPGTSAK